MNTTVQRQTRRFADAAPETVPRRGRTDSGGLHKLPDVDVAAARSAAESILGWYEGFVRTGWARMCHARYDDGDIPIAEARFATAGCDHAVLHLLQVGLRRDGPVLLYSLRSAELGWSDRPVGDLHALLMGIPQEPLEALALVLIGHQGWRRMGTWYQLMEDLEGCLL